MKMIWRWVVGSLLAGVLGACTLLPQQALVSPSPQVTEVKRTTPVITIAPSTTPALATPIPLPTATPPVVAAAARQRLAAGAGHTCLATGKQVACWGADQFGQLGGDDSFITTSWFSGTVVSEFDVDVLAVVSHWYHTCAVLENGELWCWGSNERGQLGDGTTQNRGAPGRVAGLDSAVVQAAPGVDHTCALTRAGRVWCWGGNDYGQLGDGTLEERHAPVEVTGLGGRAAALFTGTGYTCALIEDGSLECWGDGSNGRFAVPGAAQGLSPVVTPLALPGLEGGVILAAAGDYHLCVLTGQGNVLCWGSLASAQEYNNLSPMRIEGLDGPPQALAAGGGHTCLLNALGGVMCWGDNYFGQIGYGTNISPPEPVIACGLDSGMVEMATGSGHTCALFADDRWECWGDCTSGQCGGWPAGRECPVEP